MLKTASDFNSSINYIMADMTEEMNAGLKYQLMTFDSDSFNSTFEFIETKLNKFYEKTRILEDVISYSKEYLEQAIYSTKQECRSILSSIEENRDKLKTNSYISYNVSLVEDSGSYTDRDDTQLQHCSINNSTITLSGQRYSTVPIKSIKREQDHTPYRSSLDNLLSDGVYRVFYLLDGQITGGLKEDFYIELTTPSVINFIDMIPSNCTISNIRYINENDGIEYEDTFKNIITRNRKIKALRITLTATLYKTSTYYIDKARMVSNFWDEVADSEYNTAMGITDIIDLDELAGVDAFKKAYAEYVANLNEWKEEREAVAERNTKNGYNDTVPYIACLMTSTAVNAETVNRYPFNADPYPTAEQDIKYS